MVVSTYESAISHHPMDRWLASRTATVVNRVSPRTLQLAWTRLTIVASSASRLFGNLRTHVKIGAHRRAKLRREHHRAIYQRIGNHRSGHWSRLIAVFFSWALTFCVARPVATCKRALSLEPLLSNDRTILSSRVVYNIH